MWCCIITTTNTFVKEFLLYQVWQNFLSVPSNDPIIMVLPLFFLATSHNTNRAHSCHELGHTKTPYLATTNLTVPPNVMVQPCMKGYANIWWRQHVVRRAPYVLITHHTFVLIKSHLHMLVLQLLSCFLIRFGFPLWMIFFLSPHALIILTLSCKALLFLPPFMFAYTDQTEIFEFIHFSIDYPLNLIT